MALWKVRVWKLMGVEHHSLRYSAGSLLPMSRLFSSVREGGDHPISDSNFNDTRYRKERRSQSLPDPIPNRPLRGERSPRHRSTTHHAQSPPDIPCTKTKTNRYDNLSDDAFLDKFKLRLHNNKHNQNLQSNSDGITNDTKKDEQDNVNAPDRGLPPPNADEIFKKMKETGLIPNAVAMLDGLCKDGLVQEAMKLFGLMREKGTIPEVVIYTAVVEGFCKAQKFDDAKRIFQKMQANGITPNAFSYTVLIQGLYKCDRLDDAVDFSFQMLEAGHSPNVATFVGLIDGLCREKGVQEARSVLTTMQQKGFFLNEKAVREFLDKKGALSSLVWEAVFGKKTVKQPF